jgi:hypothetical protein
MDASPQEIRDVLRIQLYEILCVLDVNGDVNINAVDQMIGFIEQRVTECQPAMLDFEM